ncbi:MAG TPA: hypothetical protein EYM68_02225 [Gammaproteobacteria bacterium]|nr:hypothetical protein [Gammaproteobacteria bacterium]
MDELKGKWSFVYFGYSACSQVCNETLTKLNRLILALSSQENAQPIQPDEARVHFEVGLYPPSSKTRTVSQ